MTNINLRLKDIRRQRNLSQEELAKQLGISRQAVIALEQGNSLPSLPVIVAILKVLDIPFAELFANDWSPFRVFTSEGATNQFELGTLRHGDNENTIPVNVDTLDNHITVMAELAGIKEEDVTIDLSTQHVLIMAIRKPKLPRKGYLSSIEEISFGPMMRILSLPYPINTEAAQAEFDRGLLYLILPKLLPDTKRRITFKNQTT